MNEIIINNYPKSSVTEAIKNVRTNLRFSSINKQIQTIMVTSSIVGEGKSFVSANLAAVFASANEKVLLIDCDFRRGRQQKIFEIKDKTKLGLSNLLIDKDWTKNLKNYVNSTEIENLDVITSGVVPPNPSVLLESEKMKKIVDKFKSEYDVIIFDTPPVSCLTDALIMARLADVTLIVARANKTTFAMLEETKVALENVNASVAGVILNYVEKQDSKYYNNYYIDK